MNYIFKTSRIFNLTPYKSLPSDLLLFWTPNPSLYYILLHSLRCITFPYTLLHSLQYYYVKCTCKVLRRVEKSKKQCGDWKGQESTLWRMERKKNYDAKKKCENREHRFRRRELRFKIKCYFRKRELQFSLKKY